MHKNDKCQIQFPSAYIWGTEGNRFGKCTGEGKKSETNTIFDEAQQWVLFKALFK